MKNAVKSLTVPLSKIEPFIVVLKEFDYFIFKKQVSIFLKAESKEEGVFQNFHETILNVFPDCIGKFDEQEGGFQHHITIGKVGDELTAKKTIELMEQQWKPVEFEVKEVYFRSKDFDSTYQNRFVVQLGMNSSKPHFDCIPDELNLSTQMSTYQKTSRTSFVGICPPENTFTQINKLRKIYNSKSVNEKPHITLVKPFYPYKKMKNAVKSLTVPLSKIEPFIVVLKEFDYFIFKKQVNIFLKAESKEEGVFQQFHQTILNVFPDCIGKFDEQEGGFQHHITIGKVGDELTAKKTIELMEQQWKPVEFEVKEVYFFTKDIDLIYQNRYVIPVGKNDSKPHFECIPE
eukprot:gene3670-6484_t